MPGGTVDMLFEYDLLKPILTFRGYMLFIYFCKINLRTVVFHCVGHHLCWIFQQCEIRLISEVLRATGQSPPHYARTVLGRCIVLRSNRQAHTIIAKSFSKIQPNFQQKQFEYFHLHWSGSGDQSSNNIIHFCCWILCRLFFDKVFENDLGNYGMRRTKGWTWTYVVLHTFVAF